MDSGPRAAYYPLMMTDTTTQTPNGQAGFFPLPFTPKIESCASARIDRATAAAALRELAIAFNVATPGLQWSATRRGKYRWGWQGQVGTVILGPNVWRGWHTLVHEFAHHLDRERQKATPTAMAMFRFGRRKHHGDSFSRALVDTVKVAYRDVNEYAWGTEYRTVQTWWRRYGYAFGRVEVATPTPAVATFRLHVPGTLLPVFQPMAAPVARPRRLDPWRETDRQAKALGFCRGAGPGYRADLTRFCIEHSIVYPGQRTAAGY